MLYIIYEYTYILIGAAMKGTFAYVMQPLWSYGSIVIDAPLETLDPRGITISDMSDIVDISDSLLLTLLNINISEQ